jgi:hypothetical protein
VVPEGTDEPNRKVLPVFVYPDVNGISFYVSIVSSIYAFYRDAGGGHDNNYGPRACGDR